MRSRSVPTSPRNSLMSCRTQRAEVRITPASATPTVTMAMISACMLSPFQLILTSPNKLRVARRRVARRIEHPSQGEQAGNLHKHVRFVWRLARRPLPVTGTHREICPDAPTTVRCPSNTALVDARAGPRASGPGDSTTQRRCAAGCGERCSPAGARESNPSTVEGSLVGRGRDDGGWRRDRVLLAVLRSDRIARVGLRTERWPVDDDARSLRPWAAGQGWPVRDRFQYPWNDQREFHRHRLRGHIR